MKFRKHFLTACLLTVSLLIYSQPYADRNESVYSHLPNDTEAVFFTPEEFNIKADGKEDVSDQLQAAINIVKTEKNFGIVFLPEGKYLISKTIYIPAAVRLIGYGKGMPER